MSFKPLSKRYVFDNTLSMDIDSHVKEPIANWIQRTLEKVKCYIGPSAWGPTSSRAHITTEFKEYLHISLREVFPQTWGSFIEFVMNDKDRTLVIMQLCLDKFAKPEDAERLEIILSKGGSGYAVIKADKTKSEYDRGGYDLVERVPEIVKKASAEAIEAEEELSKSWIACYGIEPNYNEVVGACQNVLESLLRDKYLPNDKKPQLGKLIRDIKASKKLEFTGSDLLSDQNIMLELIDKAPEYRGMHKAGTGKDATKQVAEFVLHTTIYLWNLHRDERKKE